MFHIIFSLKPPGLLNFVGVIYCLFVRNWYYFKAVQYQT